MADSEPFTEVRRLADYLYLATCREHGDLRYCPAESAAQLYATRHEIQHTNPSFMRYPAADVTVAYASAYGYLSESVEHVIDNLTMLLNNPPGAECEVTYAVQVSINELIYAHNKARAYLGDDVL